MIKKNKINHKKENHNQININSNNDNIFIKIHEELVKISLAISKQTLWLENHEKRIEKLEMKGGRGKN